MKKSLIIGLGVAALMAGTASMVKVDSSKTAPAAVVTEAAASESEAPPVVLRNAQVQLAQLASNQPYVFDYERGPRIIHVPQANSRTNDRVASRAVVVDEDEDYEPPQRPRAAPPKPRVAAPPPVERTPRWKPRGETPTASIAPPPPPPGPRRAVLSAPPPASNGPTPLRPTRRFDNQAADAGQKFAPPRPAPVPSPVVSETQPPLGYSPPATPEPVPVEETSAIPDTPLPQD